MTDSHNSKSGREQSIIRIVQNRYKQILQKSFMNQGLKHLALQAQKNGLTFQDASKVVMLPFYAFIDQLTVLMRKYVNAPQCSSWAEYITVVSTDKQFSNLYASWLKYNTKSLQCKLISTLLPCSSTSKLSTFLKLRKLVLKAAGGTGATLDNVLLQHQDIIGILHSAYKLNQSRKLITQGIKNLFISYRIQQPKIYSCVFIEYALSLHERIHAQQSTQATIQSQYQQYGTIPQSILAYSSIISQNASQANNNPMKMQSNTNQSNANLSNTNLSHLPNSKTSEQPSKYISNFQSIIHQENGLYRKIKSSQVSLQGFKVIDHKFHNNVTSIQEFQSKNKNNQSSLNMRVDRNRSKQRNSKDNNQNIQYSLEQPMYAYRQSNLGRGSYTPHKKSMERNQPNPSEYIYEHGMHQSNEYNKNRINSKSPQSLTYTQKYKSPDISYDLTPDVYASNSKNKSVSSKIKESRHYTQQKNNNSYERVYDSDAQNPLKLIKVEEAEQNDNKAKVKDKEGGYLMWKKLVDERNRSFKQKMLKADYQRLQTLQPSKTLIEDIERPGDANQSINVIHDSIVRHSGIGR